MFPWFDVIVIAPDPLVIVIPFPAVRFERVYPAPFPIRRVPFAADEPSSPVPPLAVGSIDVPTVFDCDRSIEPNAIAPEPSDLNTWFVDAVVNDGTPDPFVIRAALLAVAIDERVSVLVV